MALLKHETTNVTPVTEAYQITEYPDATPGPNWISFSYWVHTDDSGAGAFEAKLVYTDPTGQEREIAGAPISLADPAGFQSVPVQMTERELSSSMFEFRTNLIGSAGTSKVSYRILMSPSAECDLQTLPLTLVP